MASIEAGSKHVGQGTSYFIGISYFKGISKRIIKIYF